MFVIGEIIFWLGIIIFGHAGYMMFVHHKPRIIQALIGIALEIIGFYASQIK